MQYSAAPRMEEEAVRALSTLRVRHNHHHPVKLAGPHSTFDLLYVLVTIKMPDQSHISEILEPSLNIVERYR